jgi:hypothetical protein
MQRGVLRGSFAPSLEQRHSYSGLLNANKPATIFSECNPCTVNLSRPRITPQLSDKFMNLR